MAKERKPRVKIHPDDLAGLGIADGDEIRLVNGRGAVISWAEAFDGVQRGVVIAEGVFPNSAHPDGRGINTLTGADQCAPYGGPAFHDNRVRIEATKNAESGASAT
jgi:anaerobic selenocysteine-containing dehydrogenase